ncbi:MAG: DUF932 domain-containing protein [Pirellulales bacterium]
MALDLATNNGHAAMAYFGGVPWHRLGTSLKEPATADEAITAAGLDYYVSLFTLTTIFGEPVERCKAVVRDDTRQVLGVVSNSYLPIQNHECFGFLDDVVADEGLRYHTAGALGQGERVWLLAKLADYIRVAGSDDIAEQYLLLSNSHNGNSVLRVYFTPIRVVCANTLAMAGRTSKHGIAIRHSGNLSDKIAQAREVLGLAMHSYDNLDRRINHLASYYPTAAQLQTFFARLYPDPDEGNRRWAENPRTRLLELFESGRGQDLPEVRHTAWAAVNAVTEYVDDHRPTRGRNPAERAERRLRSQWFGSGSRLKARAWNLALEMTLGN